MKVNNLGWFAFGVLVAVAGAVFAQGGYPSIVRARQVIAGQPNGASNPVAIVAKDATGDAWIGFYENTNLSTLKAQIGYAATGDDSMYFVNGEAGASPAFNFRANSAGGINYSPDNGATNIDFTPSTTTATLSFSDACTTTPTMVLRLNRVGTQVFASSNSSGDAFNCTSDSTGFADPGTPIPAGYRPAAAGAEVPVFALDNTAVAYGVMVISSAGSVQINRCSAYGGAGNPCVSGWTAAGTKGLNNVFGTWATNN